MPGGHIAAGPFDNGQTEKNIRRLTLFAWVHITAGTFDKGRLKKYKEINPMCPGSYMDHPFIPCCAKTVLSKFVTLCHLSYVQILHVKKLL